MPDVSRRRWLQSLLMGPVLMAHPVDPRVPAVYQGYEVWWRDWIPVVDRDLLVGWWHAQRPGTPEMLTVSTTGSITWGRPGQQWAMGVPAPGWLITSRNAAADRDRVKARAYQRLCQVIEARKDRDA